MQFNKTVLVAGLIALTGVAASAQVTVYGIIDLKLARATGSLTSLTKVDSGGLNGSRLGFRGSEDLGGGNSAKFVLEADMNNDTGAVGAGAKFFSRMSYVSLAGPLGDVRLGRDYTPTFIIHAIYDPFGACCTAVTRTLVNSLEFGRGSNVRADNSISINSAPAASGLRWQAMASVGEGVNNQKYTGARIGYAMGPYAVDVATAKYTDSTIGDLKVFNAGASFKMGELTFSGVVDFAKSGTAGKSDGYQLALTYLYNVTEFRASYSQVVRKNAAGVKTSTVSLSPGLGVTYNLSKRTGLYATYARLTNGDGASSALNGATTAVNKNSTAYDLGIRHSF